MAKLIKVRNIKADETFIVNLDNVTHIDIYEEHNQIHFNFAVVEPGSEEYLDYVCVDITERLRTYLEQNVIDLS